ARLPHARRVVAREDDERRGRRETSDGEAEKNAGGPRKAEPGALFDDRWRRRGVDDLHARRDARDVDETILLGRAPYDRRLAGLVAALEREFVPARVERDGLAVERTGARGTVERDLRVRDVVAGWRTNAERDARDGLVDLVEPLRALLRDGAR